MDVHAIGSHHIDTAAACHRSCEERFAVQPKTHAQRPASKQCAPTCIRFQPGMMPASSGVLLNARAGGPSSSSTAQLCRDSGGVVFV